MVLSAMARATASQSHTNAIPASILKQAIDVNSLANFQQHCLSLLAEENYSQREEYLKTLLRSFLEKTHFADYAINIKNDIDLAIHADAHSSSPVEIIFEIKSLSNKSEMPTPPLDDAPARLACKALYELMLYFLRERDPQDGTPANLSMKQLIITDTVHWYVFDAKLFEKLFYNSDFRKQYRHFAAGKLSGSSTAVFYNEVAAPYVQALLADKPMVLEHSYLNLHALEPALRSFRFVDKPPTEPDALANYMQQQALLSDLYWFFSPEHLLKKPLKNDSNSLNKAFYDELLHIIGLSEVKEGGKKVISRCPPEARQPASLLESTISKLDEVNQLDTLIDRARYGANYQEQLFNVALELVITWLNRLLFLKLLESQLISYHPSEDAASYALLNIRRLASFDEVQSLFFSVLAKPLAERSPALANKFANVPYLNSSLFEPSPLEQNSLYISNLADHQPLSLYARSVLQDAKGERRSGSLPTLEYIFAFLDAYRFSSEGSERVVQDKKTLINASVLGLIFEKLNGYKDGSFFTPGFITMYMCRESLRRAVVQAFNDTQGWRCQTLDDVYNKIDDKNTANAIINGLKICDPAVGSGHFLVSALNELIAIKSELGILRDRDGRTLRDYSIMVENDELIIKDDDGGFFAYNPNNPESQRVQETLFHEKQTLIEGCLFGVDINPNSVKICRLRLWIELLKHAYYKPSASGAARELETLPNIDINIKVGNALISRFALDANIGTLLKSSDWDIQSYQNAVQSYRNATNKAEKREMEALIARIKESFRVEIDNHDPDVLRLQKVEADLLQGQLFDVSKAEAARRVKLEKEAEALREKIAYRKDNPIYRNAFEWRFEFPEVLNDAGDFVGFDVIIGNPPYGVKFTSAEKYFLRENFIVKEDIFSYFMELTSKICNFGGHIALIVPIFWLNSKKYLHTRALVASQLNMSVGVVLPYDVFVDAYVDTGVFMFRNRVSVPEAKVFEFSPRDKISLNALIDVNFDSLPVSDWQGTDDKKIIFNPLVRSLEKKILNSSIRIGAIAESGRGILAKTQDYIESPKKDEHEIIFVGKLDRYERDSSFTYVVYGENLKEKPLSFKLFQGKRILIRRIVNRQFRIMATLANEDFVVKKDIYVFKLLNDKIATEFLLGIVNSKLVAFYKTQGTATARKDDFTQITLADIRELGIPKSVSTQHHDDMVAMVEEMLDLHKQKAAGKDVETAIRTLDAEIDALVYGLYDLSEDEIAIVEGTINN